MTDMTRDNLLGGFIAEINEYLPQIEEGLATLAQRPDDEQSLQQVYRLIHNIKGASSQLSLAYICGGARLAEDILEAMVERRLQPDRNLIAFIGETMASIGDLVNGHIRDERKNATALETIVSAYYRVNPDKAGCSEDELSHDIDRLLRGESIVGDSEEDTRSRLYRLLGLTCDMYHAAPPAQVTTSLDLEQWLQDIQTLVQLAELYSETRGLPDVAEFTGALTSFLHWLLDEEYGSDEQFLQLVVSYAEFLQLLLSGSPSGDTRRIDQVIGTMDRVRELAGYVSPEMAMFDKLLSDDDAAALTNFDPHEELDTLAVDEQHDTALAVAVAEIKEDVDEGFSAADEIDLAEIFAAECEEHLLVINHSLAALEQVAGAPLASPEEIAGHTGEIRRAVHTLKGAAAMTGHNELAEFAHNCEDLLDMFVEQQGVQAGDLALLVQAIDLIEEMAGGQSSQFTGRREVLSARITALLLERSATPVVIGESEPAIDDRRPEIADSIPEEVAKKESVKSDRRVVATETDGANVRVKLASLDEIVSLENELIVTRTAMERGMERMFQAIGELNMSREKLRRLSHELEVGFEVESLYGFGTAQALPARGSGNENAADFSDFDPLELDRYSQLNMLIRSFNELSVDVGSIHNEISGLASELRGHVSRQQLMMTDLQDRLMRVRMTPMSSISRPFFRTVRKAAEALGKQVRLTVEGEDVYLDRFVWKKILDPIMHILRNAVDHGIEAAGEREALGKPGVAVIRLQALQRGSHVVLEIIDDGRGIDTAALQRRLRTTGRIEEDAVLSEDQLLEYLFVPGVSTRDDATQISGRGVGLDVVKQNIHALRGTVRVRSIPGGGTTFVLRIPISLSLLRAVTVTIGPETYAVPLQDILEIRRLSPADIDERDGLAVQAGEQRWPARELAVWAGLRPPGQFHEQGQQVSALVVAAEPDNVALLVDSISGQQEIIVKDLGTHLKRVQGISGATIMGDGSLVPILNINDFISIDHQPVPVMDSLSSVAAESEYQIMIVDDSISVRQSISRLVKINGWIPTLAVDGVEATEKLDSFKPDVIVLDIEMPRMNGFEFMGVLRNHRRHRDVPVVMLTSRVSDKHRKKAEEVGVDHYLTKPYQEQQFVSLLQSLAANGRSGADARLAADGHDATT